MPKVKKRHIKTLKPKFYIFCEGLKTERFYFEAYKEDKKYNSKLVDIQVINTKKNTAKELVLKAKEYKKTSPSKKDIYWVVFDKDGYTKHREAFELANRDGINIAFSSIAFETWILLHFKYTTKSFAKSEKVISFMRNECNFEYEKNDKTIYNKIKDNTELATKQAEKLNQYSITGNKFNAEIYDLNPYTDVYKLLKSMDNFWNELNKDKD